jgi:hypothetical protein
MIVADGPLQKPIRLHLDILFPAAVTSSIVEIQHQNFNKSVSIAFLFNRSVTPAKASKR